MIEIKNHTINNAHSKSAKNSEQILADYREILNSKYYAFLNLVKDSSKIDSLLSSLPKQDFEFQTLLVGIGGSSQGIKSLVAANHSEWADNNKILFLDHVDEHFLRRQLNKVKDFRKVNFCVISKSGETTEVAIVISLLESILSAEEFKQLFQHLFIISENKNSSLKQWAELYQHRFIEFPKDVDGRFSVLSEPTLVPYALCGGDPHELLKGAKWLIDHPEICLTFADFALNSFKEQRWLTHFWFYQTHFSEFGIWLEQLWAESLGKEKHQLERRVSTPFACIGSNDQHSLLQQMEEGFPDKSHVFFSFSRDHETPIKDVFFAKKFGLKGFTSSSLLKMYSDSTSTSLSSSHPILTIHCNELSARIMGALYASFMVTIALMGAQLKINIYGQPGVEKSKKIFHSRLHS